jgi:hypothetical protein
MHGAKRIKRFEEKISLVGVLHHCHCVAAGFKPTFSIAYQLSVIFRIVLVMRNRRSLFCGAGVRARTRVINLKLASRKSRGASQFPSHLNAYQ